MSIEKTMKVIEGIYNNGRLAELLRVNEITAKKFYETLNENPDLDLSYSRAQQARMELLADEIVDIADTDDDAQRARNRIDSRKWLAGKLAPKKYGDRIDLNVNQTVDIKAALLEAKERVNRLRVDSGDVIEVKPNIIPITSDATAAGFKPVVEHVGELRGDQALDSAGQTFDEQTPNK